MADEMLGEFINEATEHFATAASLLLSLTKTTAVDPETVNACFRSLHTVKGCAGFLDLHRIRRVAHAGEQVLDALRSGSLGGSAATWDILLATVVRLEEILVDLEKHQVEPAGDDHELITQLEAVLTMPTTHDVGIISAVEERAAGQPPASLDACVGGLIACGRKDTDEICRQVARITDLAKAEGWQGELRATLEELYACVATMIGNPEGMDGEFALADMYVHVQALQRLHQPVQQAEPQSAPARPGEDRSTDLLHDFTNECQELLIAAERVVLGKTTFTAEDTNEVFRSFHTIKGMAAYLAQPAIERAAHRWEECLLPVRDGHAPADQVFVENVLSGIDQVRALILSVNTSANPLAASAEPTAPRLGDLLVDLGVPRAVIEETAKILKPDERLGDKLVETGKVARQVVDQAAQAQAQARNSDGFSRVATSKLEEMVNMVGELLIAQAMVVSDPDLARFPNLSAAVQRQSRIMRSLQVLSLSLRMVPLKATFQKMARAVHDTARKVGKEIEFVTAGEDTEIDRTLAEAMADPLLHMVRNAVDHGIEPGPTRSQQGKTGGGTVRLAARQTGDDVIIELSDDGGGMDPQRLRAKAIEKGLIPASRVLSELECFDLVFLPGFSTAAKVTDVSGRGVGMDVVRRQVRNANGSVHIQSQVGKGSTFTIRLPLTTAIMDTMLLRCGSECYLIPVASVVSMLRPTAGQVESIFADGRVLNVRGRELPVVRLGVFFAIPDHQVEPSSSLILVIENRGRDYALQVDEVLGQRQVVIKPFDHTLTHHPGVSGSAILGDGRVALILNPARLLASSGTDDQL